MADQSTQTVGASVRKARAAKGMSQKALATAMHDAGLTHWRQNTVSRVENGRQPLDVEELQALTVILGKDFLSESIRSSDLTQAVEKILPVLKKANTMTGLRFLRKDLEAIKQHIKQMDESLAILEATWWPDTSDDAKIVDSYWRDADQFDQGDDDGKSS